MKILFTAKSSDEVPVEVSRVRRTGHDDVQVPPVDLYETDDGWILVADIPGARKEDLDLEVDKGVLTIHARRDGDAPEGRVIHEEFERSDYFRSFPLSDQVDRTRITANVVGGQLTIALPKADAIRPRKINVESGD